MSRAREATGRRPRKRPKKRPARSVICDWSGYASDIDRAVDLDIVAETFWFVEAGDPLADFDTLARWLASARTRAARREAGLS
jgi:hypothetical protein